MNAQGLDAESPGSLRQWRRRFLKSQLFQALKTHKLALAWVSLTMALQSALTLLQPWPIRALIDHVVENPTHQHGTAGWDLLRFIASSMKGIASSREFAFIYSNIGFLLLIYVSNSVLLYLQNISMAKLGQKVVLKIREITFSQLIAMPHSFFEKARTGDLTSRISKDAADIQDLVESLITITVRSVPTVIGILIVSFSLDWIYALTFLLVVPVVYWSNAFFTRRTRQAIKEQMNVEGEMASRIQEAFYHHKAVASLSMENEVVESFMQSGAQSAEHGVRAGRFQGILTASLDLVIGATSLLVLFVGILRIMHGCLTVGQLTVFLAYLNSLFKPIREVGKFSARIAKSSAGLERLDEIVRVDPSAIGPSEAPDAVDAPALRGRIEFRRVTFGYDPGQPVLKDFSLNISPGRTVAIVGDSGSGKSTVVQLLLRLYDPLEGAVEIDGIDIRRFKLSSLRNQIAVVLQDSYLFNTTIAENIAIAKPGSKKQEIVRAARDAEANEFIVRLPHAYETTLGEDGAGLSGGQKRRIAIARAFLRNAPILLLDEPTVGLDAAAEQEVTRSIRRLARGKTSII
ncbi:MAG: ABC transporter ATP-binding protein, partial [Syntrophobacteraceae bacterium]|nr:ABC transporter ATP-binding protein [Syntrophobacteraceae bacterium]